MTDKPREASRGAWVFEHFLALLTLGSFVYVYWLLSRFDLADLNAEIDPAQLPLGIVMAGTWSVIAALVFWVRMYRDFFRNRPRHAAAWGAALFFGAHLTALVYFLVIWRPRTTRTATRYHNS